MVKEYFPKYETIGCFARITDITPKTVEELRGLRALGYDGITIGVETGDDEMLAFMNKGFQSKDTIEQCKKLETANISYNFFYLTGISGAGRAEIGAKETAKVFNQLHPKIIESSMLTIYKNSELYEEIQKENWREESEIEKLIELKTLIENLKITTRIVTDGEFLVKTFSYSFQSLIIEYHVNELSQCHYYNLVDICFGRSISMCCF